MTYPESIPDKEIVRERLRKSLTKRLDETPGLLPVDIAVTELNRTYHNVPADCIKEHVVEMSALHTVDGKNIIAGVELE